jgi:hypothetical protein
MEKAKLQKSEVQEALLGIITESCAWHCVVIQATASFISMSNQQAHPAVRALRRHCIIKCLRRNLGELLTVYSCTSQRIKSTHLDFHLRLKNTKIMTFWNDSTTFSCLSCKITLLQFKLGKLNYDERQHLYFRERSGPRR